MLSFPPWRLAASTSRRAAWSSDPLSARIAVISSSGTIPDRPSEQIR